MTVAEALEAATMRRASGSSGLPLAEHKGAIVALAVRDDVPEHLLHLCLGHLAQHHDDPPALVAVCQAQLHRHLTKLRCSGRPCRVLATLRDMEG